MAGEIVKDEGICLDIRPWSKTSHVVSWLTRSGRVATLVKGAVRPKSAFLGQYDLNYTCEVLYYARARGELHALRECAPKKLREHLRGDYRALLVAGYLRRLAAELCPEGPEAEAWYELLERTLDGELKLKNLLAFEMEVLALMGIRPNLAMNGGELLLRGERKLPVSEAVARCLENPLDENSPATLVDAARVIGVYYQFHVDCASEVRRAVVGMISKPKVGEKQ